MQLNEELLAGDLRRLVNHVFEIDSYSSKMGDDKDIVVLSFTVEQHSPATDLVNFVERGYEFVLDADATPGELSDGRYKVFVELERTRHVPEQIMEILNGVGKLCEIDQFKFRYHKGFNSIPVNEENLKEAIPATPNDYDQKLKENVMNNFSNFFNRSYLEAVAVDNDDLVFQKIYSEPLRMRIKGFDTISETYKKLQGKIILEQRAMSEVLYFTKYVGNYNITKVGDQFVFENQGYAVVLEKV